EEERPEEWDEAIGVLLERGSKNLDAEELHDRFEKVAQPAGRIRSILIEDPRKDQEHQPRRNDSHHHLVGDDQSANAKDFMREDVFDRIGGGEKLEVHELMPSE